MLKFIISIVISFMLSSMACAAPVFLDNVSEGLDPIIYLGEAKVEIISDGSIDTISVYTNAHSVDIMLNTYEYNHRDWGLFILTEPHGKSRQLMIKGAMEEGVDWVNTKSGSRVFWALGKRLISKNNILTFYGRDNYYNDEGEFMGSSDVESLSVNLAEFAPNFGWRAVNQLVINYLDKEYKRRYGRDNGKPIQ